MPELNILDKLLLVSFQQKAKLTLFAEGLPPMLRMPDNTFTKLVDEPLSPNQIDELLSFVFKEDKDRFDFTKNKYWVGNYETITKLRFKVVIFTQAGKRVLQFEKLPDTPPKLADLNMPDLYVELLKKGRGLFIIGGPKGSGKTTRLASSVQFLIDEQPIVATIIEEAQEYRYVPSKGVPYQIVIKKDIPSLEDCIDLLTTINPEAVAISDIKSRELARLALDLALGGGLVITTIAADGVPAVLEKFIGFFPLEERDRTLKYLSMSLSAVISGNLFNTIEGQAEEEVVYAYDFWFNTPDHAKLVAQGNFEALLEKMADQRDKGYRVQEYTLRVYIRKNMVSLQEALNKAARPGELQRLMEKPY